MATSEPSTQDMFSGTKEVTDAHRFDEGRLFEWMTHNIEGFEGPLTVRQFKGGQSNPTFKLHTPDKTYVLRRKPPGKLLPSAHAVDREYRVTSAIHPLGFPVAKPYALCEDDNVIGTMFYVMDCAEGRILWDLTLADYEPKERRAIYEAKVKTFANLHTIDWKAAGLEGYGKEGDYVARQIHRWTKQYKSSETRTIPEIDQLIDWLPKNIPENETTTIVHGDYRLDNMVLHPTEPKVIAVLDWELSTLGDPIADFSYHLMSWYLDVHGGQAGISSIENLAEHGIPTAAEYVELYCKETGRDDLPELEYYFAYNAFRLAAIAQGVVGRVRDGTAANANTDMMDKMIPKLAAFAYEQAVKAGMPT